MTIQNIPLFQAMGAKLNYLEQRQGIIARNIANADTPDYRPHDLTEIDFGSVLDDVVNRGTGAKMSVRMQTTNPLHMPAPGDMEQAEDRKQKITYEVAPAGNAVVIEEQMVKATKTNMDFNLITNLMRKNVAMIRTALGRSA